MPPSVKADMCGTDLSMPSTAQHACDKMLQVGKTVKAPSSLQAWRADRC
jgi:hypothetical protein